MVTTKALKALFVALGLTCATVAPALSMRITDMPPLVSTDWLASNSRAENLVVLDLRAPDEYAKGHVPNAVSAPYQGKWRATRNGVAGVLPELDKIDAYIESLGISNDSAVVIVPAGISASEFGASARVYWTLSYLGLDDVAILEGGLPAWIAARQALSTRATPPTAADFTPVLNEELLASTADVAARIERGTSLLVDARPPEQFLGQARHKLAKASGRLPGAINLDQNLFYDIADQRLKSLEQLQGVVPDQISMSGEVEIVSYCNTGHWAATNWFVLHEVLGYDQTTLYDESMVGWTQADSRPLER